MKTQLPLQSGQIFLCCKNNRQHGAVRGKYYLYDYGELKTYTTRNVTVLANGSEMLALPGVFERAEGCPFCRTQVYDASEDQDIQDANGQEHDGAECAADWDARVKHYCRECGGDTDTALGNCPKCDAAKSANK